jgi:hypothetical protein
MSDRERPTVVCLCGSTRFMKEFTEASRRETLAGRIVLSVGLFGHAEGIDMGGPVKAMLDELHLRKIDLADEVLVIDVVAKVCGSCGHPCEPAGGDRPWSECCGATWTERPYVGDSTRREVAYARAAGKPVRSLSSA